MIQVRRQQISTALLRSLLLFNESSILLLGRKLSKFDTAEIDSAVEVAGRSFRSTSRAFFFSTGNSPAIDVSLNEVTHSVQQVQ
mmetsp:Transcript_20523/g.30403  ORF Transcript_20523/g.30403 Transcript_20523/m.30403 type:complete len:84 (-) Transcript_20523:492-743(-)